MDKTFGHNGSTVMPQARGAGPGQQLIVTGLLSVGSSRIWASGSDGNAGLTDYTMRFTTSGKADPGFRKGTPYLGPANADSGGAQALVPTPDGGAVVAAGLYGCCDGSFVHFTRLTKAGRPYASFGHKGRLWYHDVPGSACGDDDAFDVSAGGVRLSNGRYRFAGSATRCSVTSGVLVGLDGHGQPDTSVGASGLSTPAILDGHEVWSMGADSSDRLYLLIDDTASTLKLVRTNRNGVLDTTYADHGALTLGLPVSGRHIITPLTGGSAPTMTVSRTGQVYLGFSARSSAGSHDDVAVVAHVGSTGVLDTGFGHDGYATYHPAGDGAQAWLTALGAPGGGQLMLGLQYRQQSRTSWRIVRIDAQTGAPDATFGSGGAVASTTYVNGIARATSKRIVTLGYPRSPTGGRILGNSRLTAYVG